MLFSGRSIESKEPHEYKTPNLTQLIDYAKNHVRKAYKKSNESRLELITLLEVVHDIVANKNSPDLKPIESDLQDVCLGAWVFCFETIANEYRLLNPEFKEGYIYNSGSSLYKILLNELRIDKNHKISEKHKLDYLCKFYNFIFKDKEPVFSEELSAEEIIQSKKLKIQLKEQLTQMMQSVLAREAQAEKRVLTAIPCESAIDYKMMKLYTDYLSVTKSNNQERIFLTQLAVAICKNNTPKIDPDNNGIRSFLSRSERIKIGTLLYIMHSIYDSYKVRSPFNSELYTLCDKVLLGCFSNLDNSTKLNCLTAFLDYISNSQNREDLEKYINKNLRDDKLSNEYIYIDPKIHLMIKQINSIIDKVSPLPSGFYPSNVTIALAGIGAIIGAAPGYGAGYAVGYGLSLMDQVSLRKEMISGLTRSVMAIFFETGTYFGYYAADLMITATLERFFGKMLEALSSFVFAASAGGLSFVVYDVSYKTARDLCSLYFNLDKNMKAFSLCQADLEFINTLLELPEKVLPNSKKEKLRNIVDLSAKVSTIGFLSRASFAELSSGFDSDIEEPAKLRSLL